MISVLPIEGEIGFMLMIMLIALIVIYRSIIIFSSYILREANFSF